MINEKLVQMEEEIQKLGGTYILNHARRVYHLSKMIATRESIEYNDDILCFASYFHDVSVFPPFKPDGVFDHALESSKIVPSIAKKHGFSDADIEIITEIVKYHNVSGQGRHVETRLMRNADGVDYLGFLAVARDFSKQPQDMKKAVAALKTRKAQFYTLIDYSSAKEMAALRLSELENFIERFEEESFGMY